ncbi:peptidoglycan DD-metalloendopeptidase family protein [Sphaerisporangium sp. NPDC088356]|uniref:M23 family metallopeptidase n=1 Tax=Sphaerisporangium sp. NPDC088356 TaxID=3154871 RepID=UPI003417EC4C
MRSGRLAAIAAAVLVTAACTAPGGVAGISTLPPAPTPDATASTPATPGAAEGASSAVEAAGTPSASPGGRRGEIDAATLKPSAAATAVKPPPGDDPVRVPPPRLSRFSYVFPVRGCRISYARKQLVLPKTTIWAGKGCSFVAPVSGTVHEVNAKNRWKSSTDHGADREGRFVSILGADGVLYFGGHLDTVAQGLKPGMGVSAGQVLGRIGDSGNARGGGSNLYFAVSWAVPSKLWWVRRGMVDPWTYLDAWLNGNHTLSPAQQVAAVRARVGATPPCRTLCTSKPGKKPEERPVPTQSADPDVVTTG